MYWCFFAADVQTLDGGLLDHGDLVEGDFVLEDQAGDEDSGVGGQLERAQVADLGEVLAHGLRAVAGWVVAQNTAKD